MFPLGSLQAGGRSAVPIALQEPYQGKLVQIVREGFAQKSPPGIVAGIAVRGQVVALTAIGVRKRDFPEAISVNDPVMIGSVTKPMVNTVVAKCVLDGKLSWEDTLAGVAPDVVEGMDHASKHATLRQFVTHRAGLSYDMDESPEAEARRGVQFRDESAFRLELIKRSLKRFKPAGMPVEKDVYSNLGPIISALMVERKTGKAFESLIQSVLVEDFGLRSLKFGDQGSDDGNPTCARGHMFRGDKFIRYGSSGRDYGDMFWKSFLGGNFSVSCLDMVRFGAILSSRRLSHHPEFDSRFFSQVDTRAVRGEVRTQLGLVIFVNALNEVSVGHTGNTGRGEWAYLSLIPAKQAAVFAYANRNSDAQDFQLGEINLSVHNWLFGRAGPYGLT